MDIDTEDTPLTLPSRMTLDFHISHVEHSLSSEHLSSLLDEEEDLLEQPFTNKSIRFRGHLLSSSLSPYRNDEIIRTYFSECPFPYFDIREKRNRSPDYGRADLEDRDYPTFNIDISPVDNIFKELEQLKTTHEYILTITLIGEDGCYWIEGVDLKKSPLMKVDFDNLERKTVELLFNRLPDFFKSIFTEKIKEEALDYLNESYSTRHLYLILQEVAIKVFNHNLHAKELYPYEFEQNLSDAIWPIKTILDQNKYEAVSEKNKEKNIPLYVPFPGDLKNGVFVQPCFHLGLGGFDDYLNSPLSRSKNLDQMLVGFILYNHLHSLYPYSPTYPEEEQKTNLNSITKRDYSVLVSALIKILKWGFWTSQGLLDTK